MHWNVCGNLRVAGVLVLVVLSGCRTHRHRGGPDRTIVVRDATEPSDARAYDSGDRSPSRIEVVVADPRSGGAGPSALTSLVGKQVKVQFRRDALGLTATTNAPVPLTGQGLGGRAVSINGTVRVARGGWLVLERDRNTYWVPQASILLIETADMPTTAPTIE